MNLPEGTHIGYINNPLQGEGCPADNRSYGADKNHARDKVQGFILIDQGKIIAASFISGDNIYKGNRALEIINASTPEKMEIRRYNADEYQGGDI